MMTKTRKNGSRRRPLYQCQECGRKFYSVRTAQDAQRYRCTCGGVDIDLYVGD